MMYGYFCYDRWNLKTELEHMERIDSDIMDGRFPTIINLIFPHLPPQMFKNALQKEQLSVLDFAALLSPAAQPLLEQMAQKPNG